MPIRCPVAFIGVFLCALSASLAAGQDADAGRALDALEAMNIVPAPPVPPATISRGADGSATVRAVRVAEPLRLDGRLDEPVYVDVPSIDGFIQQDPEEGAPTTERTEVWIFFDDANIYVSARCWDSQPEREIGNEMRRDAQGLTNNEHVIVIFDTFRDRRNGMFFQTNILGAQRDALITDESAQNTDWNAVWDVKTARFEQGWTAEFSIPFKSLRYNSDPVQVWGVNFRRIIRWKNESTYLTPIPAYMSQRGIWAVSRAANLVGLETPSNRLNLEVKPYAIGGLRTDLGAANPFRDKGDRDAGLDVKYGVTKGLTLDLTYNTDFAQVEDDTQQVNLTRFNLQFPERREFFLEGQGIFNFGGVQSVGRGGGNTPILFFSRRIGLNEGRSVPIAGGGRLTGRAGPYSIGLLNIQAQDDVSNATAPSPATNFSVIRLKRDVLSRSNVGVLYTRRDETAGGGSPTGETFGVDGLYSLSTSLNVTGYYARTRTATRKTRNDSYLGSFDYNADRYGLQVEHLKIGEDFNPEMGFRRRSDVRRTFAQARFSPRPASNHMTRIRRFVYQGSVEYIENNAGRLDYREQQGQFQIEFQNSDRASLDYTRDYEFIPEDFRIARGVTVPLGAYLYQDLRASYSLGPQHRLSGSVSVQAGQFYGGTRRTVSLGGGRLEVSPQLALEPSVSVNRIELPFGQFTTTLVTDRTTYTITPHMFVSALVQYNSASSTFATNARFRWEYQPGSELFVVYSDGRDTRVSGFPASVNRAFIVKITKLFRI